MNGDPIGSDEPRGKDCSKRMGRYDGSFTPTEQKTKDQLMKQFTRFGEGVGGNTKAYREGWERTFGRAGREEEWDKNEAFIQSEIARLSYPRPWWLDMIPDDRKSVYASNYDCIDWSK